MADPILIRGTPAGVTAALGPYPDLATLTATFPPAQYIGRLGLVGNIGGPYNVYSSDGSTWGASGGGFGAAATVKNVTSFPYTVLAADRGSVLRLASGGTAVVNVPAGLGLGFHVGMVQAGAGVITFTGVGATVTNRQGFTKTAGSRAAATLIADAADDFTLAGDLSA